MKKDCVVIRYGISADFSFVTGRERGVKKFIICEVKWCENYGHKPHKLIKFLTPLSLPVTNLISN